MKIKYLGTAAYEGIPALFCDCPVCRHAKEHGGKEMRSRSQALVDDRLLIDFNGDTVWHSHKYGLNWNRITHCVITHSHSDHFYPEDMEMSRSGFSHPTACMHYYAAQDGYEKMVRAFGGSDHLEDKAMAHLVEPGVKFTAGGYEILPLWANHSAASSPVFYSIRKDGKGLLYAHDTGIFPESSWELLQKEQRYDFISLDCTGGNCEDRWENGHMCLTTNLEVLQRMREMGLADDDTIVVVNHFSHNGAVLPDELDAVASVHGILVSWDGMEVEF